MEQACYRTLHRYKYQLREDYHLKTELRDRTAEHPLIRLAPDGTLTLRADYAWDGPSGPTLDTATFMRGALVHDALYQLIRLGQLPPADRLAADRLLRRLCREDGMWSFRAWYVYWAVRLCGARNARPGSDKPDTLYRVPSRREGAR